MAGSRLSHMPEPLAPPPVSRIVNHNPRNLRCVTVRDFVPTRYRSAGVILVVPVALIVSFNRSR